MYKTIFGIIFLVCLSSVLGSPKKYQSGEGEFSPSHRYYESDLSDQSSYQKNYKNKTVYTPQNPIAEAKRDSDVKESRFGSLPYGTSGSGYGGSNGVSYNTMKLDIGGVALGALIGLGIILVIPKIANIFSGLHGGGGGYARSLEEEMSSVTNILARLDNSLAANNIDSTSCTQRIICTFVNDATKNRKAGEATGVDEFVLSFTNNSLFSTVVDGTAIKEAVEIGRTQDAEKCITTYAKCPLSRENMIKVISSFIPSN